MSNIVVCCIFTINSEFIYCNFNVFAILKRTLFQIFGILERPLNDKVAIDLGGICNIRFTIIR